MLQLEIDCFKFCITNLNEEEFSVHDLKSS